MTHPASPSRRELLLSFVLATVITLMAGGMGVFVMADKNLRNVTLLSTAALHIRDLYGGEVNLEEMFASARAAMLDRLDRYSGYIPPTRFGFMREEFTGKYGGIGVTVFESEQGLQIVSIREGGPADKAGILSGDILTKADSVRLAGMDLTEASTYLRGESGSTVLLTVFRPVTEDEFEFEVEREDIDLLHIPYAGLTTDSVLYIRLLDFQAGASRDLKAAVDSLLTSPTRPVGLVLDLRSNPGGLFSEAFETVDLFLPQGEFIVGTQARSRWDDIEYRAQSGDITAGLPIAVIINRGTASSAEIVAGALGQAGRAVLVGDTTFGKGLVQGFSRYADGSGLRLTISRYFLKDSLFLNEFDSTLSDTGHGLPPDVYVGSIETDEFPLYVERSGLLRRFARRSADSIAIHPHSFELESRWLDRFGEFADNEQFSYESSTTAAIRTFVQTAEEESSSEILIREARILLRKSQQRDRDALERYSQHIRYRLRQIAYEQVHGLEATYREVILTGQPEIRKAIRTVRERAQTREPQI
jgi:carboxyl-terminal processing protease